MIDDLLPPGRGGKNGRAPWVTLPRSRHRCGPGVKAKKLDMETRVISPIVAQETPAPFFGLIGICAES